MILLPDLPTSHAEPQAMVKAMHAKPFVWSKMGQDAGQPLDEIIIRKEAERRTGDEFWWGLGTPLGPRVESEAISNGRTLPVLFSELNLGKQEQAPNQNTYVWNGWRSIPKKGRHDSVPKHVMPKHVLVLGGNPDTPYYALVCRCDTELVLADRGPFDPAQCLTLANRRPPGVSQRSALLEGQVKHPHGPYRIAFSAHLVVPWFVRLTDPRVLTAAELARVRQYKTGDDWLSLVKSLRG
jgi:hypothetical protein